MGKAIVVGAAILLIVAAVLLFAGWYRARNDRQDDKRAGRPLKGDLNERQERALAALVDDARNILTGIGVNDTVEAMADPEVIRLSTRRAIGAWLVRYNNTRKVK